MRLVAAWAAVLAVSAPWLPPIGLRFRPVALRARLLAALAAGGLVAAVLASAGHPPSVAAAAGSMVAGVPSLIARAARRRAERREAERWPDLLAAVRSRIAGGAPLPDAVRSAGRHIGGRFTGLDGALGGDYARHLERLRSAWADPIADRVLATLDAAAAIGGSRVDDVVHRLADSIADELRLRRAHHAALTQQRVTAAVALLAPWAILGLSLATNPAAVDAFSTPTGNAIVLGGLATTLAGYALAARTARLRRQPRVFR